jgi:hypothetical protein
MQATLAKHTPLPHHPLLYRSNEKASNRALDFHLRPEPHFDIVDVIIPGTYQGAADALISASSSVFVNCEEFIEGISVIKVPEVVDVALYQYRTKPHTLNINARHERFSVGITCHPHPSCHQHPS